MSYLSDWVQQVCTTMSSSMPSAVLFGVPQGLILGSILFLLYTADLLQLVKRHHLMPHGYADDTQICGYCQPSDAGSLSQRVSICRDEVAAWMKVNQLQLNPTKTEVLWCVSSQRQHLIPTESVCIGDFGVQNLGVCIDADISMRTHVTNTIRACFWHCARSAAYDGFSSARLAHTGPITSHHQAGPV